MKLEAPKVLHLLLIPEPGHRGAPIAVSLHKFPGIHSVPDRARKEARSMAQISMAYWQLD